MGTAPRPGDRVLRRRSMPAGRKGAAVLAGAFCVLALATGCSSSSHKTTTATSISAAPTTPAPTTVAPTTLAVPPSSAQVSAAPPGVPTVPDCGGGAYKPDTLLIVCGVNSTMATNVTWSAWTASGATGSGTVHLVSGGTSATSPGHLTLSRVTSGPLGPQFTLLTVTWMGPSPDGKASDTFQLSEVP
jgi:hypothetical protein